MSVGTGNITNEKVIDEPQNVNTSVNLSRDLGALLDSECNSDMTLIADGNRFSVHKTILIARSPVFAAMFQHNIKEVHENEVDILDVDGDVLEQMIRFMYTGKVDKLDVLAGRLLTAADKYALEDLKQLCDRAIFENLSLTNVVSSLIIADRHNSVILKEQAIDFMKVNATRLVDHFTSLVLSSDQASDT